MKKCWTLKWYKITYLYNINIKTRHSESNDDFLQNLIVRFELKNKKKKKMGNHSDTSALPFYVLQIKKN